MAAAHSLSAPLGRITIATQVIAQIAERTALESYGVVGMSASGRVKRLLPGAHGVSVGGTDEGVALDLFVTVEHGLNLAEVASGLRNRVAYEVARLTGLRVASVEVHIQDVRQSA